MATGPACCRLGTHSLITHLLFHPRLQEISFFHGYQSHLYSHLYRLYLYPFLVAYRPGMVSNSFGFMINLTFRTTFKHGGRIWRSTRLCNRSTSPQILTKTRGRCDFNKTSSGCGCVTGKGEIYSLTLKALQKATVAIFYDTRLFDRGTISLLTNLRLVIIADVFGDPSEEAAVALKNHGNLRSSKSNKHPFRDPC